MSALSGKVAVVLGASAERGTGWAVAKAFAAAGARVVVGARRFDRLQALARTIDAVPVECDLGDERQIRQLAEIARTKFGRVDVAVNAAAVVVSNLIAEVTAEDLDRACRFNFHGNVFFVKHMAEAIGQDGAITIVSSMSTTHPVLPHMAYACAKAAMDCMVRYAAIEYGPRRIRVNSVLPSVIRSEMAGETFTIPGFEEAFASKVPLGRVSEPDDLADAIAWLSTSAFATGLNLHISGGNQLTQFPSAHEFPQDNLRRHPGTGRRADES